LKREQHDVLNFSKTGRWPDEKPPKKPTSVLLCHRKAQSSKRKGKSPSHHCIVFSTVKNTAVTMHSLSLALLLLVSVILFHGSDAFSSPLLHTTNARWSSQQQGTIASEMILPFAGQRLVHRGGRDMSVLYERSTSSSSSSDDDSNKSTISTASSSSSSATTKSLEEKMKGWEATDEEIRAATLGGVVPQRSDAFDLGLYIAFPIMVATGLLFAFFPLIMGSIDTSSVGPPPTM
jgi:hypothetical protein